MNSNAVPLNILLVSYDAYFLCMRVKSFSFQNAHKRMHIIKTKCLRYYINAKHWTVYVYNLHNRQFALQITFFHPSTTEVSKIVLSSCLIYCHAKNFLSIYLQVIGAVLISYKITNTLFTMVCVYTTKIDIFQSRD